MTITGPIQASLVGGDYVDFELDKRLTVVETHIDYIRCQLEQNKMSLYEIQKSIGIIERNITKQNSVLPRLEASLKDTSQRADVSSRISIEMGMKQKIIWSALGLLAGGLGAGIVKLLMSGVFS
jgi:hypothetical protein